MSTNKTPNYNLHAWEPDDDFLRSEMNENFAALDAASRVVFGIYTGDGAAEGKSVVLGFRPTAVLVFYNKGALVGNSSGAALAIGENSGGNGSLVITDTGFVAKIVDSYLNTKSTFYFAAFY